MKKRILFLGAILATSLIAGEFDGKSNAEIIASTDSKNAVSLANSAFELNKRVGEQKREIKDTCEKFHNLMKNELNGKTKEEKEKFMAEFKKAYNAKIDAMSSSEKAEFDPRACIKAPKNDKMPFPKKGEMKKPRLGKGDAEIPPMPPQPKPEPKAQGNAGK